MFCQKFYLIWMIFKIRWPQKLEFILANLFRDANFSILNFMFFVAKRTRDTEKYSDRPRVYTWNSPARVDKHGKTLARTHVKENWIPSEVLSMQIFFLI